MRKTYDLIHCTRRQWENETMRALAAHHFGRTPDCQYVLVVEHGGWCLGYRRDGSIWATANDAANLPDGARPTGFSGLSTEYPAVLDQRPLAYIA